MAQAQEAVFYQGDQRRINHTPAGDIACGVIIDLGDLAGIVTTPEGLKANALGSVDVDGTYKIKKAAAVFAQAVKVYWDTVGRNAVTAPGANIILLGESVEAAAAGDDHVKTWINKAHTQV
jgi:predicted RecA/RadA family phage recombinase